jgi:2-phospho-L-lactate guanylyltransferase
VNWTALIPIKPDGERKTRLAGRLTPEERTRLAQALLDHLIGELGAVAAIDTIVLLSAEPSAAPDVGWIEDKGRGLNPELEVARETLGPRALLVIHADLPLVGAADIAALLAAAEATGCAIAADRHGSGTNALALADGRTFGFRFGPGSLALHRAESGNDCRIVERPGLAIDCDTPDDLDCAIAGGFVFPSAQ